MCKHCLSFTIADLNYICYFAHSITLILMFTASQSFIEVICVYIYYCLYLLCIFVCHFNQLLEKSLSNSKIDQFSVALNNNSIIYTAYWGFLEYNFATFIIFFRRTLRVDGRGDPGKSVMNDAALSYMSINNNHHQTT